MLFHRVSAIVLSKCRSTITETNTAQTRVVV